MPPRTRPSGTEAARLVTSLTNHRKRAPRSVKRLARVGHVLVFAIAVMTSSFAVTANAQSSYGGTAYGAGRYSTDTSAAPAQPVLPPNTGFQVVVRAASEQPATFWGSAGAVAAGGAGAAVGGGSMKKRKQEN